MPRPRKKTTPQPESQRVAAYRKKLMQEQHYRSVSFLASPEEFGMIEAARERSGLTTKELMLFYLSGRYLTEALRDLSTEADIAEDVDSEPDPVEQEAQALMQQQARFEQMRRSGAIFAFAGKAEFLVVSLYLNLALLPGLFPFELELLRDFASHREALQYYLLRRDRLPPARQLVLMQRASSAETVWQPESEPCYQVRLRLNQIYPQIQEYDFAGDPTDYRAEFAAMATEYANESNF